MSRKLRLTLYILAAAVIAACGYFAVTALGPSTQSAWIKDLQFEDSEVYDLTFHLSGERSCPQIPISVGSDEYPLMFDTGCGSGIFFTDMMQDKLEFTLIGETEALNRDGSHRGWSKDVVVNKFD